MEFLVLADDLTGALEVGAKFSAAGLSTLVVSVNRIEECSAEAVVIDTETRHSPPDEARNAIRTIATAAGCRRCKFVYKKTDSTLRGNIASELSGLAAAVPDSPIIYVPAYPEMGRVVMHGQLLVDGVPVCRSSFVGDPLNPVYTDDVPALVATHIQTELIDPADVGGVSRSAVYVVNAATPLDVQKTAEAFWRADLRLAAGPAGFAGQIAKLASGRPAPTPVCPRMRKCLVVSGSLHPRSIEQVRTAVHLWRPACSAQAAVEAFGGRSWVLLQIPAGSGPAEHAAQLGNAVADVIKETDIDGVVVFGGDSAFGILNELGVPPVHPIGEVLPGIPVARIDREAIRGRVGPGRDVYLVTKAGGFGTTDVLSKLEAALAHP